MDRDIIELKTGESLVIRQAMPSDAPAMNTYLRRVADETTYLSFDASEWTTTDQEEAEIVLDHLNSINKIYYVALINEEIVSLINAGGSHKKRLRHNVVFGISVLRAHWGKGIGTLMINKIISWAKSNPVVKKINLMVSDHNPKAIALYEKLGFEHEGRLRNDNYVDGVYYDGLCMGMWIG